MVTEAPVYPINFDIRVGVRRARPGEQTDVEIPTSYGDSYAGYVHDNSRRGLRVDGEKTSAWPLVAFLVALMFFGTIWFSGTGIDLTWLDGVGGKPVMCDQFDHVEPNGTQVYKLVPC